MNQDTRGVQGTSTVRGREPVGSPEPASNPNPSSPPANPISAELFRSLAEVKGQAQFLLYLADQIEDSLEQLANESDSCHGTFLCKVLGMYSSQLETKHQGLGDKIAETCQEVYVSVREYDTL